MKTARLYLDLCWLAVKMSAICAVGQLFAFVTDKNNPLMLEFAKVKHTTWVIWRGVLTGPRGIEATHRDLAAIIKREIN